MKQHLSGNQLKEIEYEDRIVLLSLVTGLTTEYLMDEYKKDSRNEEGLLLQYGFDVKVGELIEIIENYTGMFPAPNRINDKYEVNIRWNDFNGETIEAKSDVQSNYCDALYEIVKFLFNKKIIEL